MDNKPLRQEDYQAMAAEVQRLRQQLTPAPDSRVKRLLLPVLLVAVPVLLISVVLGCAQKSVDPCYFSKIYDIAIVPENRKWQVYVQTKGEKTEALHPDYGSLLLLPSQAAADEYITSHHLPYCSK